MHKPPLTREPNSRCELQIHSHTSSMCDGGVGGAAVQAAPLSDFPFKNSIFWCNVFPPDVYAALDAMWIPRSFMRQDRKSAKYIQAQDASHVNANQRFKCSLPNYLNVSDEEGDRCVHPAAPCGS